MCEALDNLSQPMKDIFCGKGEIWRRAASEGLMSLPLWDSLCVVESEQLLKELKVRRKLK